MNAISFLLLDFRWLLYRHREAVGGFTGREHTASPWCNGG